MRDIIALLYYSGYIVPEFNFVLIACKMNDRQTTVKPSPRLR